MNERYWQVLEEREQGQLRIVIDKSWEDLHPRDCFGDSVDPDTGEPYVEEICRKIDNNELDWFTLRARVFYEDILLGYCNVSGLLYEDAREVLTDGIADDLVYAAMDEARDRVAELKIKFAELDCA